MIQPPRLGGSNIQVLRSQLAFEVALTAYAVVAAALLLRLVLLLIAVAPRVWSASIVYALTDPIVWPLGLFPGAGRELVGLATLPDLTAVAIVALIPLAMLARNRPT